MTSPRAKWKDMVFARVTRIVTRAHDLSLWLPQPGGAVYLGDNVAGITPKVIREYDYYFGFCKDIGSRRTFHFASPQASEIDFLHDVTGEWEPHVCLQPPSPGTLICGIPSLSTRGLSLTKWWACPLAFFELWKLIMGQHKPSMDRMLHKGLTRYVFQAIAKHVMGLPISKVMHRALPHFCRNGEVIHFLELFEKSCV